MTSAGQHTPSRTPSGGLAPRSPLNQALAAAFFIPIDQFVASVSSGVCRMRMNPRLMMDVVGASRSVDVMERQRGEQFPGSMRWSPPVASVSSAYQEPVRPECVFELTDLQTVALLSMTNRGNVGSTMCRGIAKHLQNECQDKPSFSDYAALREQGLAIKPEGEKYHAITPQGAAHAYRIALAVAKKLKIHIIAPGGYEGIQQRFSCSCGGWSAHVPRGVNADRNGYGAWSRHVAKASETKEAESA